MQILFDDVGWQLIQLNLMLVVILQNTLLIRGNHAIEPVEMTEKKEQFKKYEVEQKQLTDNLGLQIGAFWREGIRNLPTGYQTVVDSNGQHI